MQEIVFFGISGVEVMSIFFANGLINLFLTFICNKFQYVSGGKVSRNYTIRYVFFAAFQCVVQICFNNYRDVNFLVFFVAAFLLVLVIFLLFGDIFIFDFLNIISFIFNVIFAAFFDLIALLVFAFASQFIISAILRFDWTRAIQETSPELKIGCVVNNQKIKKNLKITGWFLVLEGAAVTFLWIANYFFKWF